jgi:uncharacterized protein (TIGR00661 family)
MASLNVLFNVQGEGRGHIMQAVALAELLRDAGHTVVGAHIGHGEGSFVPSFVQDRLQCEVLAHESPALKVNLASKEMDLWNTSLSTIGRMPQYVKSVKQINQSIASKKPDVIVNFYEPLLGFLKKQSIPTVAIAHQYMFYHPCYPFQAGSAFKRWGVRTFTDFTARSADRLLALSLYPTFNLPERKLTVVPPLLRRDLFELQSQISYPYYYLAYVWRPDLLREIKDWCRENRSRNVHCFVAGYDPKMKQNCPSNLNLHPIDDTLFLRMMAGCSGVATTAGFETCAEAIFLDKPLLMVPTHLEQKCNALDAVGVGGAQMAASFDLEKLDAISCAETNTFAQWAYRAPSMFVREIETAAELKQARKTIHHASNGSKFAAMTPLKTVPSS